MLANEELSRRPLQPKRRDSLNIQTLHLYAHISFLWVQGLSRGQTPLQASKLGGAQAQRQADTSPMAKTRVGTLMVPPVDRAAK